MQWNYSFFTLNLIKISRFLGVFLSTIFNLIYIKLRQKTHGIFKEEAILSTSSHLSPVGVSSVLFDQVSTSQSKKKLIYL